MLPFHRHLIDDHVKPKIIFCKYLSIHEVIIVILIKYSESYFYEILKPTLEIRNPNLDKFRGFSTSTISVKSSKVAQQLEKLIRQYSSSQHPS